MTGGIVIRGKAYQRPVQLAFTADTLTWRAHRGLDPENIATTVHDVRDVTWLEKRWSIGAGMIAALSALWLSKGLFSLGGLTLACSVALAGWRWKHPRYWLGLDLGTRWLVMQVDPACAADARALAARIERRLLTGEVAATTPSLP